MIKPTVGRRVWYRPLPHEAFISDDPNKRWDAGVTYVWSDTRVNLACFTPDGQMRPHTSVTLAQDRGAEPGECEWMPFQVGQAKVATTGQQDIPQNPPPPSA